MPRRIAFLCCVTDDAKLDRLTASIDALERPRGVDVGVFTTRDDMSLARAYNRLLADADGWPLKVYVHQDVVLENRGLVGDLLRIFRRRTVGLVGVAGVRFLPPSYVWWDGSGLVGRVVEQRGGAPELLDFGNPDAELARVECVDGVFMATQHDLPWDERIPGFDFYDVAQSTRSLLRGYDVVVPRQDEPWIRHEIGDRPRQGPGYEPARAAFAELYGRRRDRFVRSRVRRRVRRLATRVRIAIG